VSIKSQFLKKISQFDSFQTKIINIVNFINDLIH